MVLRLRPRLFRQPNSVGFCDLCEGVRPRDGFLIQWVFRPTRGGRLPTYEERFAGNFLRRDLGLVAGRFVKVADLRDQSARDRFFLPRVSCVLLNARACLRILRVVR